MLMFALAPSAHSAARLRGFTLVELLVVIAIIGALMAMLLPAVQSARESARRAQCQNNLRQVGLALQLHHDSDGAFPVGCLEWRCFGCGSDFRSLAWNVSLLPYLEQAPLHDAIDLGQAFDSPANADAAAHVLGVFVCPSSERGPQLEQGRGPSDYGGIFGERITGPPPCPPGATRERRLLCPQGVLVHEVAIRLKQVTDGATTTLVVAEDSSFPDGQWINGLNLFDQSADYVNQAPAFENDIRSQHPGGALGLFVDGGVRFLSADLQPTILAAFCTRAGEEVVGAQ